MNYFIYLLSVLSMAMIVFQFYTITETKKDLVKLKNSLDNLKEKLQKTRVFIQDDGK